MDKVKSQDLADFVFIRFKSSGFLRLHGVLKPYRPNDGLIFTPLSPRYLTSPDEPLLHDWISFQVNDEKKFLEKDLIFNNIFELPNEFFSANWFDIIHNHFISQENFYEQNVNCLLTYVFNVLTASQHIKMKNETNYLLNLKEVFQTLRRKIYNLEVKEENISDLARQCNFSRTRFTCLYKYFFNTSPHADITRAKILRAEQLLNTTSDSVQVISTNCGFSNEFTFIRNFKKYTSLSPTQFRNLK